VLENSLRACKAADGFFDISFQIETDTLLNGQHTNILDVEPVVFRYADLELVGRVAPLVTSGRTDFPRDIQHLITSSIDEPAIFCLARTGLQPIYEHLGVEGIISRLCDWFRDAKTRSYHADGWEPVPVVWPEKPILGYLNPKSLQEYAAKHPSGGHAYIAARLTRNSLDGVFVHAELPIIDLEDVDAVNRAKIWFDGLDDEQASYVPLVFCWGNSDEPDEMPHFNTWTDIGSLTEGVEAAKLGPHLTTAMNRLEVRFGLDCDRDMAGNRAVLLVLGIWRPVAIDPTIVGLSDDGTARRLELRTYYLERPLTDYCGRWESLSELKPFVGMVPPISGTLAAVSGEEPLPEFSLIGAGAIGSAFVDYATRGGTTSFSVYDNDLLLAHNLARHRGTERQIRFGKADVAAMIASERVQGTNIARNGKDFLSVDFESFVNEIGRAQLVIDASANAQVRRRLSMGWDSLANVCRSEIYHDGRLGVSYFTRLGTDHNLTMMHFQLIAHAEREVMLREWLKYEATHSFLDNELILGFGCSSMTTKMPAYKVDIHSAASFAFCRKAFLKPERPMIFLNRIDEYGLPCGQLEWRPDPVSVFGPNKETADWKVLISRSVQETVHQLRSDSSPNETGGYLLGGIDEYLQQIYVVAASSEPPNTTATPTYLQLGRWGQTPWEKSFVRRTRARLSVIGTWHSHPNSSPTASPRDWKTVRGFVSEDLSRALPTLMMITGAIDDRVYVLDATVEDSAAS
jgi:proteasome lid subunit RPN8/RPN11